MRARTQLSGLAPQRAIWVTILLAVLSTLAWAQRNNDCDVNHDGKVDVVDVQLITNMEIGASGFPCTANIGGVLGCTDAARQVVIKAALGKGCHFNFLRWSPSKLAGITGYAIYRSTSPDRSAMNILNVQGPVTATEFADVNAVTGARYYYLVKPTGGSAQQGPTIEPLVTTK